VKVTGEVKFSRLLRIEGTAEGKIISPMNAALIICKGGSFHGNLTGLGTVYVDGKVQGEIFVRQLYLGPHAVIRGNVSCQQLSVSGSASIVGKLNVSPNLEISCEHEAKHIVEDAKDADRIPETIDGTINALSPQDPLSEHG